MESTTKDIRIMDSTSFPYIFEQHVSVPLSSGGLVRCNVYRPKGSETGCTYPVIVTFGPYGKDVPYENFHPQSFASLDPAHQTCHSAWETPTPQYWTENGYIVVRGDEPGIGQSPGVLHVLSAATVDAYCDLVEWASVQSWSTGRVGLLGVSYYAAVQWQVAARNPKGLAACVPWEGFSDFYSEATRHGGILSNDFLQAWFERQIASNQYGLPGKAARNWGPDTIEGDLTDIELARNKITLLEEVLQRRYRDDPFFTAVHYNLEDVKVPILSVANWGGIMLHLRGNVRGFILAQSEFKYLRFITGRHDLPFYDPEEVEVQRSFLDAFLKGQDRVGWAKKDTVPPVNLVLRQGNPGFNNVDSEKTFKRRAEYEWPLARTSYQDLFLTADGELQFTKPEYQSLTKASYRAFREGPMPDIISFQTTPFQEEREITGHIVAHLNVSASRDRWGHDVSDIDLFLTLRHISPDGKEILYTGSGGEGVPISKGFLRVSMRRTKPEHPHHRPWMPHRDYFAADVLPVICNEVYPVDIEIWPTNVVIEAGGRLILEISSRDTAGSGLWGHTNPHDR